MDSFEWNKIVGAILGTLLFLFIVKEAAHITFSGEEPEKEKAMGYKIDIAQTEAQQSGESKPKPVDFGTLLRNASAEQGETIAKRCLQCHTFEKGGPNKTGPNLWGVLGRDVASKPDFKYSSALSKLKGKWTYERIYQFIGAPSRYVPGTAMSFPGLRRQQERINILAFLRTKNDSPPPLPEPLPKETGESGAAPAGEGEKAGEETGEKAGEKAGENAPGDGGAAPAGAGTDEKKAAAAEGENADAAAKDGNGDAAAKDASGTGGESAAGDAADTPEGETAPKDSKDPKDKKSEGSPDATGKADDGNGAS